MIILSPEIISNLNRRHWLTFIVSIGNKQSVLVVDVAIFLVSLCGKFVMQVTGNYTTGTVTIETMTYFAAISTVRCQLLLQIIKLTNQNARFDTEK